MKIVWSKNGVPIRLPYERWLHVLERRFELIHYLPEILATVQNPDAIYEGNADELLAIRQVGINKYLVVVYKEITQEDGFILTAYPINEPKRFARKLRLWP